MEAFSWNMNPKYSNEKSMSKKLPVFYDYYNLSKDFKNVYAPGEDTFVLIDSLTNDLLSSLTKTQIDYSIELGSGNGLVSACYLSYITENNIKLTNHTCVDINKDALNLTENLLKQYHLDSNAIVVESNLFQSIDANKVFDLIFFNPPYVTTDYEEYSNGLKSKDIVAAWAGGNFGSETIFEFIHQLKAHISSTTIIYLLLSDENECKRILQLMKELYGFKYEMIMKRKAQNERLGVFKFSQ